MLIDPCSGRRRAPDAGAVPLRPRAAARAPRAERLAGPALRLADAKVAAPDAPAVPGREHRRAAVPAAALDELDHVGPGPADERGKARGLVGKDLGPAAVDQEARAPRCERADEERERGRRSGRRRCAAHVDEGRGREERVGVAQVTEARLAEQICR